MKKVIISLFALMICLGAFSQEDSVDFRKFKFGFKLDPNFSWMTPQTNDVESLGILGRASFGLNADLMFTKNYAFGTGINVMKNGGNLSYMDLENRDNDDTDYIVLRERKYKLNYVEIPLTFKLRTSEIGYLTYWGQFGLGLGFTTSAKAEDKITFVNQLTPGSMSWEISDKDTIEENVPDISGDVIPVRASMIVAAGVEYGLSGNTAAIFGVTYNNGFTNVLDGNGIERDDDGNAVFESNADSGITPKSFDLKSISNHFQFTLGILF